jgi:hypothetical protein
MDFEISGYQYVQWWTHLIKGLHKNDFIMAAKTDQILNTARRYKKVNAQGFS